MDGKYVAYYRVSTAKQGVSGLGLEAQRQAVQAYLNGGSWKLLGEFTEVESGKRSDRVELAKALAQCRLTGATLIIAKLDRLARNVAFISTLMEGDVEFVACDMPQANRLTVHIMAAMAEHEAKMISDRTKAALAPVKAKLARGETHVSKAGNTITRLGNNGPLASRPDIGTAVRVEKAKAFAERVAPHALELRTAGKTLQEIADRMNDLRVKTPRGGRWTPMSVKRVLDRVSS